MRFDVAVDVVVVNVVDVYGVDGVVINVEGDINGEVNSASK